MSISKLLPLAAVVALSCLVGPGSAQDAKNGLGARPNLGVPITDADIKPWDITILPDGTNLPAGSGTAAVGAKLFVDKGCNQCHGDNAKGGKNAALITEEKLPPGDIFANKTIKNFWANSTTLFLSDPEVYSLVAYLLAGNKIIDETAVMDAKTLPQVKMPNRENFIIKFPDRI